ncbi:hypothetical protein SAMN03097708_02119 [Thiohalomonas denitrificans]|uniref:Uncharacterized protein n=1 Tax=Thiohalomonas denitrificans TaxID=415747 RepID=A0A1G5QIZ4_9GAMM|nr:hypothetical protein SAMN03097708_02119 [Thiohalomonas denitrificans]
MRGFMACRRRIENAPYGPLLPTIGVAANFCRASQRYGGFRKCTGFSGDSLGQLLWHPGRQLSLRHIDAIRGPARVDGLYIFGLEKSLYKNFCG